MEDQDRYIAGSFLAMADPKSKTLNHKARVFLIIEAPTKDFAVEAAYGLAKSPKAIVELLSRLSPWPNETVIIDHDFLNEHMEVDDISMQGD